MRLASILLVFAGCTDSYGDLHIDPSDNLPLGVGLVREYHVLQDLCEAGPDGDCGNLIDPDLSVRILRGTSVAVIKHGDIPDRGYGTRFQLTGVYAGSSVVEVTGSGGVTTMFDVEVVPVASTTLLVKRVVDDYMGDPFPAVTSPAHAFTGTKITLDQRSVAADNTPLAGSVPLTFDPGATAVMHQDDCDCYATGDVTGVARFDAPTASLELDVVGDDAIGDFTIGSSSSTTISVWISSIGNSVALWLLARDSAGQSIVGAGPEVVATTGDPSIAEVDGQRGEPLRVLGLLLHKLGTTTLDVTWGKTHKTFTVNVIPPPPP